MSIGTLQKKRNLEIRHDSDTDDSFDDIWSTIPNLIDSETEIEIDTDSDISKLNIPMLKISTVAEKNATADPDDSDIFETIKTKTPNRREIVEKLASIKEKLPHSLAPTGNLGVSSSLSLSTTSAFHTDYIHNDSQLRETFDKEMIGPVTPYTSVELQHQQSATINNPDSLIKNLEKLVEKCEDKRKQMKAKHLLHGLSTILVTTIPNEKNNSSNKYKANQQSPRVLRHLPKILRRRPLGVKIQSSFHGIMKKSTIPSAPRNPNIRKLKNKIGSSTFI